MASIPPGKGEITAFLRWQVRELEKLHVPVFLNTTVTKELVLEKKPDVVVAATGVTPIVPKKIPGVQNPNVVLGQDVLKGAVNTGRRCVVVGGGLVGVEVANHLASLLKEVTVVEDAGTALPWMRGRPPARTCCRTWPTMGRRPIPAPRWMRLRITPSSSPVPTTKRFPRTRLCWPSAGFPIPLWRRN